MTEYIPVAEQPRSEDGRYAHTIHTEAGELMGMDQAEIDRLNAEGTWRFPPDDRRTAEQMRQFWASQKVPEYVLAQFPDAYASLREQAYRRFLNQEKSDKQKYLHLVKKPAPKKRMFEEEYAFINRRSSWNTEYGLAVARYFEQHPELIELRPPLNQISRDDYRTLLRAAQMAEYLPQNQDEAYKMLHETVIRYSVGDTSTLAEARDFYRLDEIASWMRVVKSEEAEAIRELQGDLGYRISLASDRADWNADELRKDLEQ